MRILVVGDKESERAVLMAAVARLGHEAVEACDGDEGWKAYLELAPEFILSDFIMPGKNGLELCRAVRQRPFGHYTIFLLLSTLSEPRFLRSLRPQLLPGYGGYRLLQAL